VAAVALEAHGGLVVRSDGDRLRIAWREPDWLGPLGARFARAERVDEPALAASAPFSGADALGAYDGLDLAWTDAPPIATTVRAYRDRPLVVFRLEARAALDGFATGRFDEPAIGWPCLRPDRRSANGLPEGANVFGHQYTEFALPTFSDPSCARFLLLPFRPAVVEPLYFLAPDGRTLLLAPLDAFHEQVIAVPRKPDEAADGVRCGWHGDLDQVPRGFASELGLFAGLGPRACLDAWAAVVRERHGTVRRDRYADRLGSHLSYWTDNGAAYWYRTEPGLGDVTKTLVAKAEELRREAIPTQIFQLDSWFYPHEELRPFDAPEISVPPTGLLTWDARPDILPQGIAALRRSLGDPPLATHFRHFSSRSPYFDLYDAWRDGDRAHPTGPALYDRLLHQASQWGVEVFEHDWLVECFLGVRGLREAPGRARDWQEGLDAAAGRNGLTLQWCMASPADFFQTTTLRNVTSIRTSGDYKYFVGSGSLWTWFLLNNALARALGLWPFKDVFLSRLDGEGPRDGDPAAEAEALLSALSAGPVGIGDRVGRTDRDRVLRTCRADGLLVKPDAPLAALDRCFRVHPVLEPVPLVGATHSDHPAGRWLYLVSLHASNQKDPMAFRLALAELGDDAPAAPVVAYDWRSGAVEKMTPRDAFELTLDPLAWDYRVLAPILPGDVAIVGDPSLYATAGDKRVAGIRSTADGVAFDVLGAPDEVVRVIGWAARRPAGAVAREVDARSDLAIAWQAESGRFELEVAVPAAGFVRVEVACASS
jgi:hypothetical protein